METYAEEWQVRQYVVAVCEPAPGLNSNDRSPGRVTDTFELANYSRADFTYNKERLLEKK